MPDNFDYKPVRDLIELGKMESFTAIFRILGVRTNISSDAGLTYSRFKVNVDKKYYRFTLEEVYKMAKVIGVPGKVLSQLWIDEMEKDIAEKDKSKTKRAK